MEEDNPLHGIDEKEVVLIEEFLDQFIFHSDGKGDLIDIKLALKAVPTKVDDGNEHKCTMFNFDETKKSLIAFQNDD